MASDGRNDDLGGLSGDMGRVGLNNEGDHDGESVPKTEEEYAQTQLTVRAIVSSKEAGVIIGKGGKNVADLREETGVKAGVSKVVTGVHDRVLTVTGALDQISKAYAIVAKGLLEGAPQMGMGGAINSGTHRKHNGCFIFPAYTNYPSSCSPPYITQSNGYYHWSPRIEDQAHSRCFWCSYGCSEGNAPSID